MKNIIILLILQTMLFSNLSYAQLSYLNDVVPLEIDKKNSFGFLVSGIGYSETDFNSIPKTTGYINDFSDSLKNRSENKYLSLLLICKSKDYLENVFNEIKHKDMVVQISLLGGHLAKLPEGLQQFKNLNTLTFSKCKLDTFNYQSNKQKFSLSFQEVSYNELPKGLEHFKPFLKLDIEVIDTLNTFDLEGSLRKFAKRKNITELNIKYKKLKDFPESIFELTNLQKLFFYNQEIKEYPKKFDKLSNLIYARLCSDDIEVYRNLSNIDNIIFYGNDIYSMESQNYHPRLTYEYEVDVWNDNIDLSEHRYWGYKELSTIKPFLTPDDLKLSYSKLNNNSRSYFSFGKNIIVMQIKNTTMLELKVIDLEPSSTVEIFINKWNIKDKKFEKIEEYKPMNDELKLQSELNYNDIIEVRVDGRSKFIRII